MHTPTLLRALFSLPGFVAASRLLGVFGDRYARVLVLRRQKNSNLFALWPPVPRALRHMHLPGP